ncbi:hypothetical protein B0H14DRAFT_2573007 [Mycena olivaceomarginata]|nr:hypothetical protein B0H14DRAFT_2573007 [Mycena olivaceomarginata]
MSAVPERKRETRDGGGEGWTIEISRKGGRAEGAREWTNVLQSGWEGGIGEIQRAHGKNEEQHPSNSTKFLAAQVLHSVVGTGGIGGSRERHPSRRTRTQSAPVRNAATDKVLVLREERAGEPVKIEEIVDSGNVKTRTRTAPSLPRCWETLDFGVRLEKQEGGGVEAHEEGERSGFERRTPEQGNRHIGKIPKRLGDTPRTGRAVVKMRFDDSCQGGKEWRRGLSWDMKGGTSVYEHKRTAR